MRLRDKIREIREKYGPLYKLVEREGPLAQAIKSRPLLQKAFEDLKPDFLSVEEFRENLINDINKSKEEIVIYSPFINAEIINRESWLMDPLIRAKNRGVEVIIHTRHPDVFTGPKSREFQSKNIRAMESYGFKVHKRKQMHEKAVIIDKSVAYLGTTNVLSRLRPEKGGDYMLKFKEPQVVEALYVSLEMLAETSESLEEEQS
ncbi:DNA helicase [Thermococcus sp. 2319x1]|uniref:phospholipase D-like domain-containing protein n=1 Tax=Thermococcus sp. 2319x1 TaxID=1674923 RepID=UPI00073A566C|nr:phospholipase D-like domain-containing protein [Thermococcus sp. 2319x1]ALV63875.1 DNA helicase [Thermococcus sp. 2319x1]